MSPGDKTDRYQIVLTTRSAIRMHPCRSKSTVMGGVVSGSPFGINCHGVSYLDRFEFNMFLNRVWDALRTAYFGRKVEICIWTADDTVKFEF